MQKLVYWQLGEENNILREIAAEREAFVDELFRKADLVFSRTDVDFRAVSAILVGGICYTLLFTFNGVGGSFCGLDLRNTEDRGAYKKSIVLYYQ